MHFLPCFTCMALALIYLFSTKKGLDSYFLVLTTICTVYFLSDCSHLINEVTTWTRAVLDIIYQFFSLAVIPGAISFLILEWKKKIPGHHYFWRYIPAFLLGISSIILYCIIGLDRIDEFESQIKLNEGLLFQNAQTDLAIFYINDIVLGRCIFFLQFIWAAIKVYLIIRKRKKEEGILDRTYILTAITLMLILALSALRAIFNRSYIQDNQTISAIISAGLALLLIYLGIILYPNRFNKRSQDKGSEADSTPPPSSDKFKERFLYYFEHEQPFLDSTLTMDKVASQLGTNRTYISLLINSQFGLSFRDYVNRLRINYAKDYISTNRDAKLEDVALASGFSSGSQFSRKFKELEGITPHAWIRSRMK